MMTLAPCWFAFYRQNCSPVELREQPFRASQLCFRALRSRRLRQATSAGSIRLTKDSKVHPTIETKTTCGRLVPWTSRAQRFVPLTAQVDQGGNPAGDAHASLPRCRYCRPAVRQRLPRFLVVPRRVQTPGGRNETLRRHHPHGAVGRNRYFAECRLPCLPMFVLEARIRGN